MKASLIKLNWLLASQFGFDLRRLLLSLRGLPRFAADWRAFRRGYRGKLNWMPCLHDRYEEGGTTKDEYFWQDLLVARRIFAANPRCHVDVGSRVDGFVAHVASFREIEVFDVRRISTEIPGVTFRQADLMDRERLRDIPAAYCDSLSCLHAIEHFGLGRYGDPIDPTGHARGVANMASLLAVGGTFYLSAPVGRERVEFNAHRVFDPRSLIELARHNGLSLRQLTRIDGGVARRLRIGSAEDLAALAAEDYSLGLFEFTKD